ncbi:hypothetical protein GYMLUDRAFT_230895 [Collybiopsis luxurians FD-317 M1]|uniref:Zn(2)-C6 fungal-type domain-containing protein n=1 Tax=Collybiopsis luxurians FD-317 M1 TaxID=944289 RepID=A0A0D0CKG0_9AGAR|nr:hypothetical protein GYMLUDRAFT_230895 [Collybiopsis luxurians FD-317 M1]
MPPPEDQSQEESSRPTKRRNRSSRACDECHRRKIKCDYDTAPNGVCTHCSSLNVECKHTLQKQKRGPKAGSRRRPASDAKNLVYKILAAPLSFAIPEGSEAIREMIIDLAKYSRSLESELDRLQPTEKLRSLPTSLPNPESSPGDSSSVSWEPSPDSNVATTEEQVSVVDALALRMGSRLEFGGQTRRRHGHYANRKLLQTALDIRDEVNGGESRVMDDQQRRPEFWNPAPWHRCYEPEEPHYMFPEDDLLGQLVSIFFSRIHTHFPLLHGPTFRKQVFQDKLHLKDPQFGATVLAVCSLASRHCSDPRVLVDGIQSRRSAGWKYFQQIRLGRSSYVHPASLFEVQLCALASLFLQPTPLGDITSSLIGMGIRYSQEVGAHRRQPVGKTHQERIDRELWKRVYWALISLDFLLSLAAGRPRATTEDDYDLDLLIECDDENWSDESDPEISFVQPPDQPSYIAFWNHTIRFMLLAAHAQRYLVRSPARSLNSGSIPEHAEKIIDELSSNLLKWMESTPDHLRWDPHNSNTTFFQQSMVVQSFYYWFHFIIYQPFIRTGPVSSLSYSSLAICANAARSFLDLLEVYHRRPNYVVLPHTIPPAFRSSIILLVNIWKSAWMNAAFDPERDISRINKCLEVMSIYEESVEMPGRFRDILQAIITASRIPSRSRPSLLKRAREDEQQGLPGNEYSTPLEPSELPPAEIHASGVFQNPAGAGVSAGYNMDLGQVAGNLDLHLPPNYDQEDWNNFMKMVDEILQGSFNR